MEELKCFLVGFGSYSLSRQSPRQQESPHAPEAVGAASSSSPAAADASLKRSRHVGGSRSTGPSGPSSTPSTAAWLSPALRAQLHPAEVHLLSALLPLGEQYACLSAAAQNTAVGRTEGLYPSAVGAALSRIAQRYVAEVKAAATPSALIALRVTYSATFERLVMMALLAQEAEEEEREQQQQPQQTGATAAHASTAALLSAIQDFTLNKELPLAFRQIVGVCVWRAVLYTTAHYVAHGVVLHGRKDYFISVSPASAGARTSEQHTLHTNLLPAGVNVDLGMLILTAGKERRVLLGEADTHGSDHLEQLAMGTKDVAADAVFKAIFNFSLCEGGVLAADELAARVEAARALWSKALWTKVGSASNLAENLEALQTMFLCTRGDVWLAFVERCFDELSGIDTSGASLTSRKGMMVPISSASADYRSAAAAVNVLSVAPSAGGRGGGRAKSCFSWAAAQRAVTEAFTYALSVSGLAERPVYDNYRLALVLPQTLEEEEEMYGSSGSRSVEATAQLLLDRARGIGVRFSPPQGLQLVVSQKAISYYQRLYSLHVGVRFTAYAMQLTRQLFAGAIVTNKSPSADLRRAYALFQLLSFLVTTFGHYFQVDVIALPASELHQHIRQCKSVEEAKRRHDRFIWRVAEGSFLTEGSEALHAACRALCECSVTLFVLCTRYRLNYWAVDGLNKTPVEVAASLAALETRVQQKVVAALTGHLPTSSRQAERALWARVDFNRFFSYRPTVSGRGGYGDSATPSADPSAASSSSAAARWQRSTADDKPVNAATLSGFAMPRSIALSTPSTAASAATVPTLGESPPRPVSRQQRTRSTRARQRSSSVGVGTTTTTTTTTTGLRARRQTTAGSELATTEREEWAGRERQAEAGGEEGRSRGPTTLAASRDSGVSEGRTVISSAANKFKMAEK